MSSWVIVTSSFMFLLHTGVGVALRHRGSQVPSTERVTREFTSSQRFFLCLSSLSVSFCLRLCLSLPIQSAFSSYWSSSSSSYSSGIAVLFLYLFFSSCFAFPFPFPLPLPPHHPPHSHSHMHTSSVWLWSFCTRASSSPWADSTAFTISLVWTKKVS